MGWRADEGMGQLGTPEGHKISSSTARPLPPCLGQPAGAAAMSRSFRHEG